jgi:hypothetical protein
MNRNSTLAILLFLSTAFLSAHAATAPTAPNACSYLDQQAATSLYGAPVSARKDQMAAAGGAMSLCFYLNSKGGEAVIFMVMTVPKGMDATMMDSTARSNPDTQITPVSGLGDRAEFASSKGASAGITLVTLSQGKMVSLSITGSDTPARRTALTAQLRRIIARL